MSDFDERTSNYYRSVMRALREAGIPFLVGGTYALARYTGIERATKDFDIFLRRCDVARALDALSAAGSQTDLTFSHWLAKACSGHDFVDIIFSSGNGRAVVDDGWFDASIEADILGDTARITPAEEMIWSKSFVMERERFDGADVAHLFRACARSLDWTRLIARFGDDWRVLLSHLVLFGFVYPGERTAVPPDVMQLLLARLADELTNDATGEPRCAGTVLSRGQYLVDVREWGYTDGRATMTPDQIDAWTDAIDD